MGTWGAPLESHRFTQFSRPINFENFTGEKVDIFHLPHWPNNPKFGWVGQFIFLKVVEGWFSLSAHKLSEKLEFQVTNTPKILGPAGSFY